MLNESVDANQSFDNFPSIPLYDKPQNEDVKLSKRQTQEKSWFGRICPLFSIEYVVVPNIDIISLTLILEQKNYYPE